MRIVSMLDEQGYYAGPVEAHTSDSGVYVIPEGAVDAPPPHTPDGKVAFWQGVTWLFVDPPGQLNPAAQIQALEREHMLPKATRKFMLSFMEATAIQQGASQGLSPEQSLAALTAGNPGYAAVKGLDNQIEALEDLL